MKKLLLFVVATSLLSVSFGNRITEINPAINAKNVFLPVGKSGKTISLMELSTITIKDFETLTERKMRFLDRLAFKAGQKKLRNSIAEDGTINKKKLQKFVNKFYAGETSFHIGGFLLGLILGLIGVLIAYLINDEKKKSRVKWAWIGWAIWLAILLVAVVI
ncbi:MAG TPA: hypothetical protein VFP97_03025 [Chitinophagaceae bacterium]|nr:hypothetical protein [Chitinophagaceae bacterium]